MGDDFGALPRHPFLGPDLFFFFFNGELPYIRKLACQENYNNPCPIWGQPEPVAGQHENTKSLLPHVRWDLMRVTFQSPSSMQAEASPAETQPY